MADPNLKYKISDLTIERDELLDEVAWMKKETDRLKKRIVFLKRYVAKLKDDKKKLRDKLKQ